MAFVDSNGVRIAYSDAGTGEPTFVFVHGWGCDRRAWAPQAADLARDYRCISIDLRGRGESDDVPPYDLGTHAEDVAAVVRQLAPGGAIFCGHSAGGLITLLVNSRHPELVRGVVLGDTPIGPEPMRDWQATRDAISGGPADDAAAGLIDSFVTEQTPADVREQVRMIMRGVTQEQGLGWLATIPELGPDGAVKLVKAADGKPFMAFWAQSPMGDVAWLRMTAVFLRHELIAGAGHFFQLEQPAVTSALLRAFVDDVQRDPRVGQL